MVRSSIIQSFGFVSEKGGVNWLTVILSPTACAVVAAPVVVVGLLEELPLLQLTTINEPATAAAMRIRTEVDTLPPAAVFAMLCPPSAGSADGILIRFGRLDTGGPRRTSRQ
jgi:hypothetical protein